MNKKFAMFLRRRLCRSTYRGFMAFLITYLTVMFLFVKRFAIIRTLGLDLEYELARTIGFEIHGFNVQISDEIGVFRHIPDTRLKICKTQVYDDDLPNASIVMCYYNEHKMTLLRSIKSILERSPPKYLKEILLVDDFSNSSDLVLGLMEDVRKLDPGGKVRQISNTKREGLMKARVIGARNCTGDTLVFMDSHIEVNKDWLQPLLHLVKHENSTLAVPLIDLINDDTLRYDRTHLTKGIFNWELEFLWKHFTTDEDSFVEPFNTPIMPGGLFAINRKYFTHIGEYDMGMDIWGGENLEISFRVWQCGGALKFVPCSRVGHIFRPNRPLGIPDTGNALDKNLLRVAYVWMDDYKEYFFKHKEISRSLDYGNIDERLQLREKLKCSNFSWYLKNVYYPEVNLYDEYHEKIMNSGRRAYKSSFLMRLTGTNFCASVDRRKVGSKVSLQTCMKSKNQIWYSTSKSEIVLNTKFCLEASFKLNYEYTVLEKCHPMQWNQKWMYRSSKNSTVYNVGSGTCIRASEVKEGGVLQLEWCSKDAPNKWDIVLVE